jgi:hypothetical protein
MRAKEAPKVVIIILNWNNWRDSIACLDSLSRISYHNYDIILADNGSNDDSIAHFQRYCESNAEFESSSVSSRNKRAAIKAVTNLKASANAATHNAHGETPALERNKLILIENDKNAGFSEGCNLAMDYACKHLNPCYFLLLNNDTIVDRRFLDELVEAAESDPRIGFAGPKIYYCNFNGKKNVIQTAGGKMNFRRGTNEALKALMEDQGQRDETREVDYVSGACLLTKKRLIHDIGMLDPCYFMYWEEVDWCIRGRKAGYKCLQVPTSRIWHKINPSKGGEAYYYYRTRNKFWFLKKNGTTKEYLSALTFFFFYQFWVTTGSVLLRHKSPKEFFALVIGTWDGLGAVRG